MREPLAGFSERNKMTKYRCKVKMVNYRQVDIVVDDTHLVSGKIQELAAEQAEREFGEHDRVEVLQMVIVEPT